MYFYCDDTVGIQYAVDIVWSVNSRCSKRRATDALKLVHGLGLGINQVIRFIVNILLKHVYYQVVTRMYGSGSLGLDWSLFPRCCHKETQFGKSSCPVL